MPSSSPICWTADPARASAPEAPAQDVDRACERLRQPVSAAAERGPQPFALAGQALDLRAQPTAVRFRDRDAVLRLPLDADQTREDIQRRRIGGRLRLEL